MGQMYKLFGDRMEDVIDEGNNLFLANAKSMPPILDFQSF